ncbi:MAG TPA: TonB-dependent receptor [Candidatus Acidoferrum sp.]|nr:TonB-dependent receptor [Candidatus Acidoferrum sp.]
MNSERVVSAGVCGDLLRNCGRLAIVLLVAVSLLGFETRPAYGQAEAGTISGTVKDSSGAVVAGATVSAKNVATSAERSAQTGGTGEYNIPGLNPGIYEVTVTNTGFSKFQARVEVTVGGRTPLDAELSVSNQAAVVEVVAEGGTVINTTSQELSQIVDSQQVAQLPSLTRNPYDFIALAGNVSNGDRTSQGGDQSTTGRGVNFAINGQRESGTEVLLDGVENVDIFASAFGEQIPIDAVQEFRVVTNNFDAQYGRASGGIVNLTTKSGSNSFHGSGWEFNRLSAYTANTFANAVAGAPKGDYTRNQFGYVVGGPIKKDKLFFFQSTEWTRVRSNAVLQALVPTPQFLALTSAATQAYFNAYGANNFTFASTVDKGTTTVVINGVPTLVPTAGTTHGNPGGSFSNIPDGTPVFGMVNYAAPSDAGGGLPQNTHRILGRLDYNLSDKTQMFFRYALENIVDFNGGDFSTPYSKFNVGDSQFNNSGLLSLNHSYSPSLFSNSKISFSRIIIKQTYDPAAQNVPELLLSNGATVNGLPTQFPGLWAQFAGAGGEPFGGPQNALQLSHDLSWTRGTHTMRFGGAYTYEQLNKAYGAYAQALELIGRSTANGLDGIIDGTLAIFQAAIDPQGKFPCPKDNSGALVVTASCTITLPATSPSFSRSYRFQDWAAYAEDSWRLNHRLTLNYGVRYEYYGVQHNGDQKLDSNFYFGSGATIYERVRNGSVQIAPQSPVGGMWHPSYGTVGPRLGFAYDVFGDGKTSLRGGYGITYERNFGNVTFNAIQNVPNYASVQILGSSNGGITTSNFGPFGGSNGSVPLRPSSLRHINQDIRTAQTQFVSLALERQVARRSILALEYSGAHGIHLYDIAAFNQLGGGQVYLGDPLPGTPIAGTNNVWALTRANQQYSGINTRGSNASSHYSALNARFQTQNLYNTGVTLVANYTYSHSTDDLSSTFSDGTGGASNGIGNLGYLDPRNPRLDWGSSDYDIRHRLVLSPLWTTPWFKSGRGWEGHALGGFTVAGIFTARTGTPFSIFDTTNTLNGPSGYGIPRYVPNGSITSFHTGTPVSVGPNNFTVLTLPVANETPFNTALGISDFGPFPANMTGRNAFRGPGAWNLDLAVSKSFALTERMKLEFRAEGFDLFNHHNFYVNALNADANNGGGQVIINALKGGLGVNNVSGVNHDERRFGQFALRLSF